MQGEKCRSLYAQDPLGVPCPQLPWSGNWLLRRQDVVRVTPPASKAIVRIAKAPRSPKAGEERGYWNN